MRTFEDTRENKRQESGRSSGVEAPPSLRDIEWGRFVRDPDIDTQRVEEEREAQVREIQRGFDDGVLEEFGVSLEELRREIAEGFDPEVDVGGLSELQALQQLVGQLNNMLVLQNTMLDQNVAQLAALNDIADSVESKSNIVLSGTNAISESGIPEPVISDSDETDVPVNEIIIRAEPQNSDDIYIGDDDVSPRDGVVLRPGEDVRLELDFRDDVPFMASETRGEVVQVIGMI